jgi:hypothetical protein
MLGQGLGNSISFALVSVRSKLFCVSYHGKSKAHHGSWAIQSDPIHVLCCEVRFDLVCLFRRYFHSPRRNPLSRRHWSSRVRPLSDDVPRLFLLSEVTYLNAMMVLGPRLIGWSCGRKIGSTTSNLSPKQKRMPQDNGTSHPYLTGGRCRLFVRTTRSHQGVALARTVMYVFISHSDGTLCKRVRNVVSSVIGTRQFNSWRFTGSAGSWVQELSFFAQHGTCHDPFLTFLRESRSSNLK